MTPNRPRVKYQTFHGLDNTWDVPYYHQSEADAIFDAKDAEIAALVEALKNLRSFMWSEGFSDLNVPMARVDEVLEKYAAPPDTSNGDGK